MSRSGIRVKIQVTIGYLVALAVTSFIVGVVVAVVIVGAR